MIADRPGFPPRYTVADDAGALLVRSGLVSAGSLDDASLFRPTMAIFNARRPPWVPLPDGLTVFEEMPG